MADETNVPLARFNLARRVANTKPLRWLMKRGGAGEGAHGRTCRKYQAFTMADETLHGAKLLADIQVANTKPLRWLMKLDAHPDDTNNQIVANTKPLRWLMKLASSSPGSAGRSGRKYQAFTMADET